MARRGVLALHRLNEATEKVFQAFEYDVKVGNTGKGANVRDAACYVAWAFARSFDQFVNFFFFLSYNYYDFVIIY